LTAWLALAGALLLGALLWPAADASRWDWQPTLALGQPWRAWTAAWVHWSTSHLMMNAAGLGVIGLLGWRASVQPRDALAWALAWPLTQLGLLLQPGLRHFGGLSGVLHAGVAVTAVALLRQGGARRFIGAALAVGLALKLLLERPLGAPLRQIAGWDIPIAPFSHLSGALAGLLCGVLVACLLPRR
jgi:rhomboid family GlyGly-CTERM serine protease